MEFAAALEGRPRNASTHAAGVVITDKPIIEYVPVSSNGGDAVTQYPAETVAELGLLKMDFLGLRFLSVLDDAEKDVRRADPAFSLAARRRRGRSDLRDAVRRRFGRAFPA